VKVGLVRRAGYTKDEVVLQEHGELSSGKKFEALKVKAGYYLVTVGCWLLVPVACHPPKEPNFDGNCRHQHTVIAHCTCKEESDCKDCRRVLGPSTRIVRRERLKVKNKPSDCGYVSVSILITRSFQLNTKLVTWRSMVGMHNQGVWNWERRAFTCLRLFHVMGLLSVEAS
jgi:hypothetical protein